MCCTYDLKLGGRSGQKVSIHLHHLIAHQRAITVGFMTISDTSFPVVRLLNGYPVDPGSEPQQIGITIAQEPVLIVAGMRIDRLPVFAHKGRYHNEQGALWLVEIGDHSVGDHGLI